MVLETLEKLIKKRYNKFTFLTCFSFIFMLSGVFFVMNYYYDLILSLVLGVLTLVVGAFFVYFFRRMIHYHGKLMEVLDERIEEAKKNKSDSLAFGNSK